MRDRMLSTDHDNLSQQRQLSNIGYLRSSECDDSVRGKHNVNLDRAHLSAFDPFLH